MWVSLIPWPLKERRCPRSLGSSILDYIYKFCGSPCFGTPGASARFLLRRHKFFLSCLNDCASNPVETIERVPWGGVCGKGGWGQLHPLSRPRGGMLHCHLLDRWTYGGAYYTFPRSPRVLKEDAGPGGRTQQRGTSTRPLRT